MSLSPAESTSIGRSPTKGLKGILQALTAHVDQTLFTAQESIIQSCGDEAYSMIREKMAEQLGDVIDLSVKPSNESKKSKKVSKKTKTKKGGVVAKEEMKLKSTLEAMSQVFSKLLSSFEQNQNISPAIQSNYAEMKLIGIIFVINHFLTMKKKIFPQSEQDIYELIIGTTTILNILKEYSDEYFKKHSSSIISEMAVADVKYCLAKLCKRIDYTPSIMLQKYPQFVLSTSYDDIFKRLIVKPYSSQLELLNKVKEFKMGLFLYRAMIGSGKTTNMVPIARIVAKMDQDIQLIFTCPVAAVRLEVCHMLAVANIPFGVAIMDKNGEVVLTNYRNCPSDEKRVVIVADLESASELLKRNSKKYALFIDEPTIGSDQENHHVTNLIMDILYNAPQLTILASAKLPEQGDFQFFIKPYKSRHPMATIHDIRSKETMIGCHMIDFDGNLILPFENCQDVESLKKVVDMLEKAPFLDRLLPANIVIGIYNRLKEIGYEPADINEYFLKKGKLTQTEIQKIGVGLLKTMCSCGHDDDDDDDDDTDTDVRELCNVSEFGIHYNPIDLERIFMEDAHNVAGPCLVVTDDPVQFALQYGQILIQKIQESIGSLQHLANKYDTAKKDFERRLARHDERTNNEEEREKAKQADKTQRPTIDFPKNCRVNTKEHMQQYVPEEEFKPIDKSRLAAAPDITFIIEANLGVREDILILLCAGIGLYSPTHQGLTKNYNDFVLQMAVNKQLAFLIADESITYGLNIPIQHVIVCDDYLKTHSVDSFFQAVGRAGRVGKSPVAYCHISQYGKQRLMDYIHGTGVESDRVSANMSIAFDKAKQQYLPKEKKTDGRRETKSSGISISLPEKMCEKSEKLLLAEKTKKVETKYKPFKPTPKRS